MRGQILVAPTWIEPQQFFKGPPLFGLVPKVGPVNVFGELVRSEPGLRQWFVEDRYQKFGSPRLGSRPEVRISPAISVPSGRARTG